MDTVRAIILSACVVGVVSSIIEISAPPGTLKKQLDLILGIVLVLVTITPFMADDFTVHLKDYSSEMDSKLYDKLTDYSSDSIINLAQEEVSAYFTDKLKSEGINTQSVIITAQLDEYNQIEITQVNIITQESDSDRVTSIVAKELPEAEITVTTEDNCESIRY